MADWLTGIAIGAAIGAAVAAAYGANLNGMKWTALAGAVIGGKAAS